MHWYHREFKIFLEEPIRVEGSRSYEGGFSCDKSKKELQPLKTTEEDQEEVTESLREEDEQRLWPEFT